LNPSLLVSSDTVQSTKAKKRCTIYSSIKSSCFVASLDRPVGTESRSSPPPPRCHRRPCPKPPPPPPQSRALAQKKSGVAHRVTPLRVLSCSPHHLPMASLTHSPNQGAPRPTPQHDADRLAASLRGKPRDAHVRRRTRRLLLCVYPPQDSCFRAGAEVLVGACVQGQTNERRERGVRHGVVGPPAGGGYEVA
jgi:hypothetical protein